jgi:hypothetical protein
MAKLPLTSIELQALQNFANEHGRFWKIKLNQLRVRGSLKGVLGKVAKQQDFQQVLLQINLYPGVGRMRSEILPPVALYYGPVVSCPASAVISS